jgi:hypothetical protein
VEGSWASLAVGSEIVFQYILPEALCNDEDRPMLTLSRAGRSAQGEPVLSLFEPSDLAARLRALGFT